MTSAFVLAVRETIEREQLVPRGSTVVVGVSGGPDSMALWRTLLDLRDELAIDVVAAHLDHAWREDSRDDAAFVEGVARQWDARFVARRLEGRAPTANREAAGRRARYAFLHEVAGPLRALIAVAHHADDRLETFLVQWIRGAGPRGLSHPRARREDGVVRPLLERTSAEIREFLREREVSFRDDATNTDDSNLRARLRRHVVPWLRRENPEVARATARTMTLLHEIDDHLTHQARAALEELSRPTVPGELDLDGPRGRTYHPVILSWVLREALGTVGETTAAGFDAIRACVAAWTRGATCVRDLPGGIRISVDCERVRVILAPLPAVPDAPLSVPGAVEWGLQESAANHAVGRIHVDPVSPPGDPRPVSGPTVAWVDQDRIEGTLRVRGRARGDRYRPLGAVGRASLQDLFVDRKLPVAWRNAVPIVVDDRGIVWIPGFRVDHRVGITENTERALRFTFTGALASFFSLESR